MISKRLRRHRIAHLQRLLKELSTAPEATVVETELDRQTKRVAGAALAWLLLRYRAVCRRRD
jgi:hypothetical protein